MKVKPETKKLIQILLLVAMVIAVVRIVIVFRARHAKNLQQQQQTGLNPDYYVTPKKLYPYDLKSAGELTKQPAYMKEGYRFTYFPYDEAKKRSDFKQPAGLLGPIERLDITNVVTDVYPGGSGEKQIMAVFKKDGKHYAVSIGLASKGDYQFNVNEMFFYQDPHELYKHWSTDVWDAIAKHEVKPGMNELQASFAIGMGQPDPSREETKVVRYPNGGNPLVVTYREGKATEIKPGEKS